MFDDEDVFGSIKIKGRIKVYYGSIKMIRQKKMKENTQYIYIGDNLVKVIG